MKRLLALTIVATLIIAMAGCQCCNWCGRPAVAPTMPAAGYGVPAAPPAAMYADPGLTAPVPSQAPCGPGCTSCGNTPPSLSGAQSYLPTPGN